jgi:hypothetical protein
LVVLVRGRIDVSEMQLTAGATSPSRSLELAKQVSGPDRVAVCQLLHEGRTHLWRGKDAPISRPIDCFGRIIAEPMVGGLHHH